jgi:hypothetical protein
MDYCTGFDCVPRSYPRSLKGLFDVAICQNTNFRYVPEAEVNTGILNVGFGGVGYQSVTESEASYIEGGPTHSSHRAK